MKLNEATLKKYLDDNVNIKNFHIYAALSNLKNIDTYRSAIEHLQAKKISLSDLTALEFIDDEGVQQLLDSVNRFKLPIYTNGVDTSANLYDSLNNLPLIKKYFDAYTEYRNNHFEIDNTPSNLPTIFYVDTEESFYKDLRDFELDFQNKVTNEVLKLKSLPPNSVARLFPTHPFTGNISGKHPVVQKIYKNTIGKIETFFKNNKLIELYVHTPDRASFVSNHTSMLTSIMNVHTMSNIVEYEYIKDLQEVTSRGNLTYSQNDIDALWNSLDNIPISYLELSDAFSFFLYKNEFINALATKNNRTINQTFKNDILALVKLMHDYTEVHLLIESYISKSLYLKRI